MRLAAALLLLNGALTFANVWPTLGVHWRGEISLELVALIGLLTAGRGWIVPHWRETRVVLAVALVLGALGRYADVTSPALYGRPVNLYWDLPHAGEVIGMLARVASRWLIAAVCLASAALLAALYCLARWALGAIEDGIRRDAPVRIGLGCLSVVLLLCFLAQQLDDHRFPPYPRFSIPVTQTYALQAARVIAVLSGAGARSLPPSPPLRSNLGALDGDDMLLIFVESYGRTTYDRAEYQAFLRPARARLQAAIQDTGRSVVSAFVTSPTFAGTSVLAHLSLLTGIQVRTPQQYQLLMTQQRATLVSVFRDAGYRAIALMPGNQHPWPEGSFYGFDQIYDASQLHYRGPPFGWWHIPDQFSLEVLDVDELAPHPRRPLFVFLPTLSTHMPFRPIPPMQSDWPRMLSAQPYDSAPLQSALARTPQWTHLGESYVSAVQYFFDSFASLLRHRPHEPCVVVLLGDHQPAASVSGADASWDVPVHVIASRPQILDALRERGFQSGLYPRGAALGDMNQLAQWLLAAFNQPAAAVPSDASSAAALAP